MVTFWHILQTDKNCSSIRKYLKRTVGRNTIALNIFEYSLACCIAITKKCSGLNKVKKIIIIKAEEYLTYRPSPF